MAARRLGETPVEQDLAFADELVARGYKLVTGRVETLADAYEVMDELVETDLRRLPVGIPFPRWTEDGFNGDAHSTINDYLMGVGRVPNDHGGWYALEDRYVANPSQRHFFEVVHRMQDEMNDLGFGARTDDAHSQSNGRCNLVSRRGGGFMSFVDEAKKRSLFIVQHYMRMALLGHEGGWFDQEPAPFVDYAREHGEGLNPFWRLGAQFAEHNCRNAGPMIATFPREPAEEVPAVDRAAGELIETSRQLNHPWQSVAMVYDQTLLMQESFTGDNNLHYWALNGFVQEHVHMPFLYLHRMLQRLPHRPAAAERALRSGGAGGERLRQRQPDQQPDPALFRLGDVRSPAREPGFRGRADAGLRRPRRALYDGAPGAPRRGGRPRPRGDRPG